MLIAARGRTSGRQQRHEAGCIGRTIAFSSSATASNTVVGRTMHTASLSGATPLVSKSREGEEVVLPFAVMSEVRGGGILCQSAAILVGLSDRIRRG